MAGVLLEPEWLVTTGTDEPLTGHSVRVLGGRIDRVGPAGDLRAAHPGDQVLTAPGRILAPGFVNAHTHMYGVLAHGIPMTGAPTDFWSFLEDFWWPRVEDALDVEMITAATRWACGEMMLSGTTTFYDIEEAPYALPGILAAQAGVVEEMGMRGILSFEATERAGADISRLGLEENVAAITAASGDSNLVDAMMCFHTTFTCSPAYVTEAFELAGDLGVLTHCHVNEGVHEPRWALEHHGKRTLEHYRDLGVTGDRMLASQVVQLSEVERRILAEDGVRCVHMPLSNCEVGGGIAPIPELLEAGVTMGLGSDGYVNDFYEVMRGAFMMHKGRLCDPTVMDARTVFDLATRGGAAALDRPDLGFIGEGARADLQLITCDLPTPVTAENLLDQLVLWRNGSHVTDVMVEGRWTVREGELLTADLGELADETARQARRLWEKR